MKQFLSFDVPWAMLYMYVPIFGIFQHVIVRSDLDPGHAMDQSFISVYPGLIPKKMQETIAVVRWDLDLPQKKILVDAQKSGPLSVLSQVFNQSNPGVAHNVVNPEP